ncbi:MAG: helix-turn-helix transcriptional regulator [Clostridia bacterium]|nr:helix-turn-helix transcriptional regulator [Clostridia bacterium]
MDEFARRLRSVIERSGMQQKELASSIKLSPARLSNYVNGHSEPSYDILILLCRRLKVSADYLLGLTDSMTVSQPIPVSIPTSSVQRDPFFGLTPDQRELIETNIATMRKQNEKALATSTQEA